MKKILFLASFMLIAIFACTSVFAAGLPAAVEGTITLTENVNLDSKLTVPSTVKVIDLGGKTLNLKAPISISNSLIIKNGLITRDSSFTTNSMIVVDGTTVDFELDGVTIDGKEVSVTHPAGEQGSAILVKSGNDITLNNSTIVNHKFSFAGIVSVFNTENVYVINTEISNNTAKNVGILTVAYSDNFECYADSIISNNFAKEAAGIHVEYTNATIAGTIKGNETTAVDGNGGGLYVFLNDQKGSNAEEKTVTIADTAKIINNIAGGAGGGVYVTGVKENALTGKVVMMGGLISGNTAKGTPAADTLKDGGGAGVYVARGNMEILGGTIENNTSASGIGNAILVSNQGKNTKSGKLDIYGGYIDGTVKVSDTYGELAVEGGTFTDNVAPYVVAGFASKEVDGVNYVGIESNITVKSVKNGKVEIDSKAVNGQPVKLKITPDNNFELDNLKVADVDGNEIKVTDNSFVMPSTDVIVEVSFKEMAKDSTPATGSLNVTMLLSVVVAIFTLGMLVSKKYVKNN